MAAKSLTALLALLCLVFVQVVMPAQDSVDLVHYNVGLKYMAEKKYDEAVEEFRKMLTLNPSHAASYHQSGLCWLALDKAPLALYNLKKASRLEPGNRAVLRALSDAYVKNNELEKGIQALREYADSESDPAKKQALESEIRALLTRVQDRPTEPSARADSAPRAARDSAGAGPPAAKTPTEKRADVTSDPALKKIVELHNAGQWDAVLAEARALLKAKPGHPGAFYYAGVARQEKGQLPEAEFNLRKGAASPERGADAHERLARLFERQNRDKDALNEYQQVLQKTDDPAQKEDARARVTALLKRLKSAAPESPARAGRAPAAAPEKIPVPAYRFRVADNLEFLIQDTLSAEGRRLLKSLDLFLEGRYDQALNELKGLYRDSPRSDQADNALYNTGLIYTRLRLFDNARTYLDKLLREYPKGDVHPAGWVLKGVVLLEQGQPDSAFAAMTDFLAAHAQSPYASAANTVAGTACQLKNDIKNALRYYLIALGLAKKREDLADLRFRIGECYWRDGSTRGIDYFQQAAQDTTLRTDAVMEACYRLGDTYYRTRNLEAALKWYQAAVRRFPESPNATWALYQIANIYKKGGQYEESVRAYKKLMESRPDDYWALQAKWQREDAIWDNEYREVLK